MFLPLEEYKPIYGPFNEVMSFILAAMRQIRTKAAHEMLTRLRQSVTPKSAELLNDMAVATKSIQATGKAAIGEKTLAGPECVVYFGERWKEVHTHALQCRAIDWALNDSSSMASAADGSTGERNEPIVLGYAQFTEAMMKGLGRLVEADAKRASVSDVPELHDEYLTALAPLSCRSADFRLSDEVHASLRQLAAKSPEFAQNVEAYQAVTDELLVWRRRAVESAARGRAGSAVPFEEELVPGTISKESYVGLFPEKDFNSLAPTFLASAPQVLPTASTRMLNKNVVVSDIVSPGKGKTAVGQYRRRVYATTKVPDAFRTQIEAPKADLQIASEGKPLSLLAKLAIDSAERGDLAAVGGQIASIQLECCTTRFAALPVAASSLVPLGRMPPETIVGDMSNQAIMRVDVVPIWVQHWYFVADIPPQGVAQR